MERYSRFSGYYQSDIIISEEFNDIIEIDLLIINITTILL
jgi:hypothetical protein